MLNSSTFKELWSCFTKSIFYAAAYEGRGIQSEENHWLDLIFCGCRLHYLDLVKRSKNQVNDGFFSPQIHRMSDVLYILALNSYCFFINTLS